MAKKKETKATKPTVTLEERQKTMEFLKKAVMYSGLSNANTDKELEKMENSSKKEYSYKVKGTDLGKGGYDIANFGNKSEFTLNFAKTDEGKIYFNSYDAEIEKSNGEKLSQNIQVRPYGISAKEAVNLLEGRTVKVNLQNKEGKNFEAFMRLDLNSPKNEYGNFKENITWANNVNVNNIMAGSKLKYENDKQKAMIQKSLEKGNITRVTFNNGDKGLAVMNLYNGGKLNLYDTKMKPVEFSATLENSTKQTNQINR